MKKLLSILFLVFTLLVLLYFYNYDPADTSNPYAFCMLKNVTGYSCPGCGGQRALHHLLHLNIMDAARLNVFIFVFFPLILYVILMFCLRPFNIYLPDLNLSTKGVIILLAVFFLYGILRNIPYYPFTLLKS